MNSVILGALITGGLTGAFAAQGPSELTSDLAKSYADKTLECGRKNSWKLSVAIVNGENNLVTFRRDDGAYFGSIEGSLDKAKSANAFQRPTRAFAEAVSPKNPDSRPGLLSVKNVVAIEGGLPIMLGGKQVGAIGVSGARSVQDEECAKAAIE